MDKLSPFQLLVLGVFIAFALFGVILFAGFKGFKGDEEAIGAVVVWGTLPKETVDDLLAELRVAREDFDDVSYVEKRVDRYAAELTEALASGKGPDLFFLPSERILADAEKVLPIPFDILSERDFKDEFVEAGELYLVPEGMLGIPVLVDPMVLFVNRTLLSAAGIAQPPKFWDEFYTLVPRLVARDQSGNILRSGVALGEWTNVTHAKEILVTLVLQAGSPIVVRSGDGAAAVVPAAESAPFEAAVRFYSEFSNPVRNVYSWNRALRPSRDAFLAGNLAFYAGFASELKDLRASNPNLNFDVAPLPQSRDGVAPLVFARLEALAIPKASKNPAGAARAALALAEAVPIASLSRALALPPVRRDLLAGEPANAYETVFFRAALQGGAWLDPEPASSGKVLKTLVESVTTGRSRVAEAVRAALQELGTLLRKEA